MSEELKPCPFCGGEARIIAKPYEPKVCVGCDDDTCLGFSGLGWLYDSDKEATEAWNRRAERTYHPERVSTAYHSAIVCSECKHRLDEVTLYCPFCGSRLEGIGHD